jgi:hypothetical protein
VELVTALSPPLSAGNGTWQDITGKGKINYSTVKGVTTCMHWQ